MLFINWFNGKAMLTAEQACEGFAEPTKLLVLLYILYSRLVNPFLVIWSIYVHFQPCPILWVAAYLCDKRIPFRILRKISENLPHFLSGRCNFNFCMQLIHLFLLQKRG